VRVPAARLLALWAVLALAACTEGPSAYTAVYVAIDADAYVRERTDRYRIETAHDNLTLKAKDLGKLPFFLTVEPGAGKSGAAGEISVSALDRRGAVIVRRRVTLALASREQRRFEVLLTAYCAEHYQGCEARELSCDGCACSRRVVDASALSAIDLNSPLAGVGVAETCPQSPSIEGGTPSAGDASTPGMNPPDGAREAGTREFKTLALAVGLDHSCAVRSNGKVYCWGGNSQRQLGSVTVEAGTIGQPAATIPTVWSPTHVPGLSGVRLLAGFAAHVCAANESDEILCWGKNDQGQLGPGPELGQDSHEAWQVPLSDEP